MNVNVSEVCARVYECVLGKTQNVVFHSQVRVSNPVAQQHVALSYLPQNIFKCSYLTAVKVCLAVPLILNCREAFGLKS
jgi:hypothetical protein